MIKIKDVNELIDNEELHRDSVIFLISDKCSHLPEICNVLSIVTDCTKPFIVYSIGPKYVADACLGIKNLIDYGTAWTIDENEWKAQMKLQYDIDVNLPVEEKTCNDFTY